MTGNFIIIKNVKGIGEMNFELPSPGVHVLTATNGSGKTTLLVCLARLRDKKAFNKNFIQNNPRNVDSYDFSEITFSSHKNNKVTYTYRTTSDSWRPTTPTTTKTLQDFKYAEIVTMLPLNERVYIQSEKVQGGGTARLASKELRELMSDILENDKFLKLQKINIGETRGRKGKDRRSNTAFLISFYREREGKQQLSFFSELSFSLGEIYTLNLLYQLKQIKSNSLLIIDELEVALHPRVQINLLNHLEKTAAEKNLTVIISTHSSSLIKCSKNLIYMNRDDFGKVNIHYNCYPALALKEVAVEEDFQPDFVFFVEDSSAQYLIKELIRKYFQITKKNVLPLWKVLPIGGYGEVLKFTKNSSQYLFNKKIGQYAFLDNDVIQNRSELTKKGNDRSDDEQELFNLFKKLDDKIKYFDITPELGLWNWITTNYSLRDAELEPYFIDSNINTRKLIQSCKKAIPTPSKKERLAAKNYIKWITKEIAEISNNRKERVLQKLFSAYVDSIYSEPTNKNKLKQLFGPIFN